MLPSVPWFVAVVISVLAIARTEFLNRTLPTSDGFMGALSHTWWLIILAQWGLWRGWSAAPSMLLAWALFTCLNNVVRLGNAQWAVGEPPSPLAIVGSALMFVAAWMVKAGSVPSS